MSSSGKVSAEGLGIFVLLSAGGAARCPEVLLLQEVLQKDTSQQADLS